MDKGLDTMVINGELNKGARKKTVVHFGLLLKESIIGESPKPRKRTTVDGGVWSMVLVRRSKIGLLMHCGRYSVGYQRL